MEKNKTISLFHAHAEGEVGRVILSGVKVPPGATMAERARYMEIEDDQVRRICLFEPRGGAATSVNLITPPIEAKADLGLIIMEATEYPAMSGTNAMCAVTVALETGLIEMQVPETVVVLDTPAGLVEAHATCADRKVTSVTLESVPSFVFCLNKKIQVPDIGTVVADVAYSGAWFALVDAPSHGIDLNPDNARTLVELGQKITHAANQQVPVRHPEGPAVRGISFTHFGGRPKKDDQGRQTRESAVVIQPGRLDRSPCGTGTMAKLACLIARGEIGIGDDLVHVSPVGTRFIVRAVEATRIGEFFGIIPRITGRAWIAGKMELLLDPTDPFQEGFTLPDTWGPGLR